VPAGASNGETFAHAALGYIAIKGAQALVGVTGTECDPGEKPECVGNTDPAAIFSTYTPFSELFSEAVVEQNPETGNAYTLTPCVLVRGKWYLDIPASDF
jgi:hypothetical protein